MNDIKNLKKFEDDIEVLSIEDLDEEEPAPVRQRQKGKKKKRKKKRMPVWQKVLIGATVAVCVLLVGGVSLFFSFRTVGENSLKAEASENRITYNGKEYQYREDVINILCLGIDKGEAMEKQIERRQMLGMCDAILLVSIDTKKDTLKIIAIPRDVMTEVSMTSETGEVTGTERMQLCYQYAYGKRAEQSGQLTMDAVSKLLYNVPIQKFCAINFTALPIVNDAIGGVDVEVIEDFSSEIPEFVVGNKVHLEGDLALQYVRKRNKHLVDTVVLRTQRQKQYALAFLEKAKTVVAEDMTLPVTIFQSLQENMSTNISIADITYLVPELLEMSLSEDIIEVLPGESELGEEFVEFHVDANAMKEMIISTFYEEVDKAE